MIVDLALEPLIEPLVVIFHSIHMNTSSSCLYNYHLANYIHHGIKMYQIHPCCMP